MSASPGGSGLLERMPDDVLLASQKAILKAATPDRFSNAS